VTAPSPGSEPTPSRFLPAPPPLKQPPSRWRLSLLATVFLTLVVVIVWQRHAILVPLYAGLITWLKALFKAVTPKLLLVFVKNGVFIKLRQLTTMLFARFLVFSHRPWRRRVAALEIVLFGTLGSAFRRFIASPLWFRAAVALVVLALTATSAYAIIALLIIPKAIVDWFKVRALAFLNKLGVTRGLDTLYRRVVPERLRLRWLLFAKWRLGRRQVLTSQRLHQRVERRVMARLARGQVDRPRGGREKSRE